jgi:formate dehydrogenase gamma subunit
MSGIKEIPAEKITTVRNHGTTVVTHREYTHEIVFERFTLSQRIQHVVLMLSFIVLIVTGLPLLTPNSSIIRALFSFPGTFELRGLLHRIAAVVLIGLSAYHVLYSLLSERGGRDVREMIFRKKDFRDFVGYLKYNLGKTKTGPRYGRFNFIEKFEYFSVVWGTTVMIITGLMLWQEEATMAFMPKWVLDIATAVHGYEAVLAFLAIIIWHLYTVHLNPDVFPMNKVWLKGTLSEEEMKKHHPLEYEELMKHER